MDGTIGNLAKIARHWLAVIAFSTLTGALPAGADEDALRAENAALRAEVARLQAQIAENGGTGGQCGPQSTATPQGDELTLLRKLARQNLGQARYALGLAAGPLIIPDEILSAVVPDEYILLIDGDPLPNAAAAADLIGVDARQIKHVYDRTFAGFAATLTQEQRARAATVPGVLGVVENGYVFASAATRLPFEVPAQGGARGVVKVQSSQPSQDGPPPSPSTIDVYLFDTGIRAGHRDLEGRVAEAGFTFFDNGIAYEDCSGHGTHVAARIAGRTLGVSGAARLVSVKVIDRFGTGDVATVIAGIEWVLAQPGETKLVNMSLTRTATARPNLLDAAVQKLIDAGAVVVVAAGNSAADANGYTPARVAGAITVGSALLERLSDFSNAGEGVDIYAPGEEVSSASIRDVCGVQQMSGTSMAAPFVTGLIAELLQNGTPVDQIEAVLRAQAIRVPTGAFAGETHRYILPDTAGPRADLCPPVP